MAPQTGCDPGPWAQYIESISFLVGLNGVRRQGEDPQTLRRPPEEGPRGPRDLGGLPEGPEDAAIPPP